MDSKVLAAIILSSGMIVSSLIFFFAPKPGRYVYDRYTDSVCNHLDCHDTSKGITYCYSYSSIHNGLLCVDDKSMSVLFGKRKDTKTGEISYLK